MRTLYMKPVTKVTALKNEETLLSSSLELNGEVGDKTQRSKGFQWDEENNSDSPWK